MFLPFDGARVFFSLGLLHRFSGAYTYNEKYFFINGFSLNRQYEKVPGDCQSALRDGLTYNKIIKKKIHGFPHTLIIIDKKRMNLISRVFWKL